ncbi:MAG: adenylyl-sulfate kinase [Candidatus Methylomirabilales bacterium]
MEGFAIWLTGLPCAGKSTVAAIVAEQLRERGCPVELLDAEEVRARLSPGLGFSREDRETNIQRLAYLSKLLTRHGVIAVVAAISPYRAMRDGARAELGRFVEVFVKAPVEVCIARDVKGLYRKALAGEIRQFTGVSDPYEEPLHPEVVLETDKEPPLEAARRLIARLEELELLTTGGVGSVYSAEEEEAIKRRLGALGYLD